MNLELLKRLNDAGYPFDPPYMPTLEELLGEIKKLHPPSGARRYSIALYNDNIKYYMTAYYDEQHGTLTDDYNDPKEAAAELWLRLKEKSDGE